MSSSHPARHWLAIREPERQQIVSLEDNIYSIGRHSSNAIVLLSSQVSRYHATLLKVNYPQTQHEVFWIVDGNLQGNRSANGLLINGKLCLSHELKHGDEIVFGGKVKATYCISPLSPASSNDCGSQGTSDTSPSITDYGSKETANTLTIDPDIRNPYPEFLFSLAYLPKLLPHPIVEVDFAGEITYLNEDACQEFNNLQTDKLDHPILAGLLNLAKKQNELLVREVKIGSEIYEQYIHFLAQEKLIRSYIFSFSKRKQVEAALQESEERYRAVIRQVSEGILLVDTNSKRILEANPAYCRLLGYSLEEILKLTLYELVALDPEIVDRQSERILTKQLNYAAEFRHRRHDGSLVEVEVSTSLIRYGLKEVLCFVVRDITERKRVEKVLQYQAFHDALTDLPNRTLFSEQLSTAMANAKRHQDLIAVLFIGLDRFKTINDTLGHATGDYLLQSFAERLKSCLRAGDTVARWGGDEFTVLLPRLEQLEDAAKISQRIFHRLKESFEVDNHQLYLRCSIGIALFPKDGEEAETLLKNADAALYRSKEQGRNHYQFYSPTMTSTASALLRLENHLHQALERQELLLHYQPQVNVKTGEIYAMEALLRWNHQELGFISPGTFIPLAEETNLIIPIGDWVLQTACRQNRLWQEAGFPPVRVAVNLSSRQLQPSLAATVAQILEKTDLAPQWLELEITETSLMQNIELAQKILRELQAMGVYLSLDDFGTGYSSLNYLKKFPLHTLKIDQCFVRDLQDEPQDLAILAAAIALGRGFNLRVVAEGVETTEQLELLRSLGCEEMQGYWFSRPLSSENATAFLAKRQGFLN